MSATTTAEPDPAICEAGGSGMFVPLFAGDDEADWNKYVRALVYGSLMVYFFLGASIISDFFMAAIEAITGKKRRVMNKDGRIVTYYVWNDTVANLTLLALGSSAPEILLSVVEVMKNSFYSGELGPSTIVGSAAFNTLIIIAVSVIAIPVPDKRYVKGNLVYNVTVFFSMFSYIWLLFIVQIISPDIIEVWEALVTFVLFFVLVVVCFFVDKYEEGLAEKAEELAAAKVSGEARRLSGVEDVYDRRQSVHQLKNRKIHNPKALTVQANQAKMLQKTQSRILRRSQLRPSAVSYTGENADIAALISKSPPAGDNGQGITGKDGRLIKSNAGIITFLQDSIEVAGDVNDVAITVPILRRNGSTGLVACQYYLESIGATPGYDYKDMKGKLTFLDGSEKQEVQLLIYAQRKYDRRRESFQLILNEPEGGMLFNPNDDGQDDRGILTVTIVPDESQQVGFLLRCYDNIVDPDIGRYGWDLYREQIGAACRANPDSDEPPSLPQYIMHFISLPWKLIFAVVAPPKIFFGGWLLFIVCLSLIGIMTAMVSDLAEMFGCLLDIQNGVTAIIIVAPGTSLPDLFASQTAAKQEPHADASIVNVTGSNSVNVLLGIGLPWTIAAIVWKSAGATDEWKAKYPDLVSTYPEGGFIVKAGALGYSVIVFSSVAAICLGTLRIRRLLVGGELGGESGTAKGTAVLFVLLWVWYLAWNIWKSSSDSADIGQWISIGLAVLWIMLVAAVEIGCNTGALTCKLNTEKPVPNGIEELSDGNGQKSDAELQNVRLLEAADDGRASVPADEAVDADVVGKAAAEDQPAEAVVPSDVSISSEGKSEDTKRISQSSKKKKKPSPAKGKGEAKPKLKAKKTGDT